MMLTKSASALGIVLDEKTQHTEFHKGIHGTIHLTAMCAVAYLKTEYTNSTCSIHFIMGKAKVAPIRQQSVSKLELAAAVIGVRLAFLIKQQLDITISKTTFWSDSATTLQWIYNSKERHKIYVANRVAEILEITSRLDWRHVPGVLNPADDGTRWLKLNEFKPEYRWFNGPLFWKHDPTNLPPTKVPNYPLAASMALSRANRPFIDPKRFSSFEKLKRVLAFVILFISNLKTTTKSFYLTIKTVNMSKIYLLRQSQELSFEEELDCLRKGQNIPAHSKIKNFLPFISNDGVIRANGRLANANQLEENLQTPVILSGKEHITFPMLRDIHNHNGHTGLDRCRFIVRQSFIVISLRSTLRTIINRCFDCRRQKAVASQPQMAPLPDFRIPNTENFIFQNTGVDFFGPLAIKATDNLIPKRYACIFTCLTTRAVHLEPAYHLCTDSFIQAILRLTAPRGNPHLIVSDNGRNFVGASRELITRVNQFDHLKISDRLLKETIEWKLIAPYASHFRGA